MFRFIHGLLKPHKFAKSICFTAAGFQLFIVIDQKPLVENQKLGRVLTLKDVWPRQGWRKESFRLFGFRLE